MNVICQRDPLLYYIIFFIRLLLICYAVAGVAGNCHVLVVELRILSSISGGGDEEEEEEVKHKHKIQFNSIQFMIMTMTPIC